jgi:hypothetical protein
VPVQPHPSELSEGSTTGIDSGASWDSWINQPGVINLTFKQYMAFDLCKVHWACNPRTVAGDPNSSLWEHGNLRQRNCLGVLICPESECPFVQRPLTRPSQLRKQLQRVICIRHQCLLNYITCDVQMQIWHWSGGIRVSINAPHRHPRPPEIHLTSAQKNSFAKMVNERPELTPGQLIVGPSTLDGKHQSVTDISPVLINPMRVSYERQKVVRQSSQPFGPDNVIKAFASFQKDHPDFILDSTIGADLTMIIMQTPWMRQQSVQFDEHSEPVNGFVTDAAHKFFKDGYLFVNSIYSSVLRCWIPILFSYSNGASAEHYERHHRCLFEQMHLECAEYDNQEVTDAMLRVMMDFSTAQRKGWIDAFVAFHQEHDDPRSDAELHLVAETLIKGCQEHYRAGVTRISKISAIIPPDQKEDFQYTAMQLLKKESAQAFMEATKELGKQYPELNDWIAWWSRPAVARQLFKSHREMDEDIWNSMPDTNNAEEAMHGKIYRAVGKDLDILKGISQLCAFAQTVEKTYASAISGRRTRHGKPEPWKTRPDSQSRRQRTVTFDIPLPSPDEFAFKPPRKKPFKNDGRPPDTVAKLLGRKPKPKPKPIAKTRTPPRKGPSGVKVKGPALKHVTPKKAKASTKSAPIPSASASLQMTSGSGEPAPELIGYRWGKNSCFLDSCLELWFYVALRHWDVFNDHFAVMPDIGWGYVGMIIANRKTRIADLHTPSSRFSMAAEASVISVLQSQKEALRAMICRIENRLSPEADVSEHADMTSFGSPTVRVDL